MINKKAEEWFAEGGVDREGAIDWKGTWGKFLEWWKYSISRSGGYMGV